MPLADPLSHKEIEDRLAELPGWRPAAVGCRRAAGGRALRRTYRLPHLAAAILLVHIARIQDELHHHARLVLSYDTLEISVTTDDADRGLTERDFELAQRIEGLAPAHGA